jgi:anaerobic ribonucleoside-triphosphate reductase|tara:strand:- start:402 stop:581 length:180 start_codon:yes stop_codon:yes gene_type:complete
MEKEENPMGTCTNCGSNKVEIMTRVTGFFSKVNSWNQGKVGELKKRRDAIKANQSALAG